MIAGQIDIMFDTAANSVPQVRAGNIKGFAVTSKSRLAVAPDLPTVDEAGLPGFYMSNWRGLWAPKGTPADIVAKLNGAVRSALADPTVRKRLAELGQELLPAEQLTPEALGTLAEGGDRAVVADHPRRQHQGNSQIAEAASGFLPDSRRQHASLHWLADQTSNSVALHGGACSFGRSLDAEGACVARAGSSAGLAATEVVIYAPKYTHLHSGVRCLHALCDHLNRLGVSAAVTASVVDPRSATPRINRLILRLMPSILDGSMVIYPEITKGNPLRAKHVVRYLLNKPGFFGGHGMESFGASEYFIHFAEEFRPDGLKSRLFAISPCRHPRVHGAGAGKRARRVSPLQRPPSSRHPKFS